MARPTRSSTVANPEGLLEAARSGDGAAWGELVSRYQPDLERFAARRGVPEPADVVQDVFTAAADSLESFDGSPKQFRSWLYTIAYRRVADVHRRRYRSGEVLTDDPGEPVGPVSTVSTPEELTVESETASEAFAALRVLDERERAVLLARVIDEQSTADVAETLGLSTVNVRVIQSRALTKVRRHLRTAGFSNRFGNGSVVAAIALISMAFTDRAHALTGSLPNDDLMRTWMEALRADAVGRFGADVTAAQVAALFESPASGSAAAFGSGGGVGSSGAVTAGGGTTTAGVATAGVSGSVAVAAGAGGVSVASAVAAGVAVAAAAIGIGIVVGVGSSDDSSDQPEIAPAPGLMEGVEVPTVPGELIDPLDGTVGSVGDVQGVVPEAGIDPVDAVDGATGDLPDALTDPGLDSGSGSGIDTEPVEQPLDELGDGPVEGLTSPDPHLPGSIDPDDVTADPLGSGG